MELLLRTTRVDTLSTEGKLTTPEASFQFYTLELPEADGLPGSAIPAGRYPIVLLPSPKFLASADPWVKRYAGAMPHLINIPGRSDIMIHWGNTGHDTNGCILVGKTQGIDFIGSSRQAFAELYFLLNNSVLADDCFITVQR